MQSENFKIRATSLYGLEEILANELTAAGIKAPAVENGAAAFEGSLNDVYRANLMCRTAVRILVPITEFTAPDERELYRNLYDIEWNEYIDPEMTLAVDATVRNSEINNSMFAAQKCKDAIVDRVREKHGRRPSVDSKNPDVRFNLFLADNHAVFSLDSSGVPLHRRGYRQEKGRAPLNEVLAAGIVMLSEWHGNKPLIDPMCGSGTIVIEAAMIAAGIYPGQIRRDYGFQKWKNFDRRLFDQARESLNQSRKTSLEIYGSDISGKRIAEAKANAKRAGVGDLIKFTKSDFLKSHSPVESGVLIMNPPYGRQIGHKNPKSFYKSLGDKLKNDFQGFTAWIFSGAKGVTKMIGLRTSQRIQLFNGPIECRLLKYELYSGSRKEKYR